MASNSWRFPDTEAPDSPWPIFERILVTHHELELQASLVNEHEVRFAFVFRRDFGEKGWTPGGCKVTLGMACMPRVTGQLAGLFDQMLMDILGYEPHFLITLNEDWWEQATDQEREILIFHEVLHCGQALDRYGVPKFTRETNEPVLAMLPHDVEEFTPVVRRYGAWKSDLRDFLAAAAEGPQTPNDRARKLELTLTPVERQLEPVIPDLVVATPEHLDVAARLSVAELPPNVDLNRDRVSHDESEDDVF